MSSTKSPSKADSLAKYATPVISEQTDTDDSSEETITKYHPDNVDTDKTFTTIKQLQSRQSSNPLTKIWSRIPSTCDLTSYSNMVAASISMIIVLLVLKMTKSLPISSQGIRISEVHGRTVILASILGSLVFVISKKYLK